MSRRGGEISKTSKLNILLHVARMFESWKTGTTVYLSILGLLMIARISLNIPLNYLTELATSKMYAAVVTLSSFYYAVRMWKQFDEQEKNREPLSFTILVAISLASPLFIPVLLILVMDALIPSAAIIIPIAMISLLLPVPYFKYLERYSVEIQGEVEKYLEEMQERMGNPTTRY